MKTIDNIEANLLLEKQLTTLGFSEEEAKTYVQVLEAGSTSVGALAKKVNTPRPTLYYQLGRLQERGLISQTLHRGIKTFVAEPPQKINLLFSQHIEELKTQQKSFNTLLPELEKKAAQRFLKPKFQLYEGLEGVQQILQDVLLYPNAEYLCFWPPKEMVEVLSTQFFHKHNRVRIRIGSSIRTIWPKASIIDFNKNPSLGTDKGFMRQIRVAPEGVNFQMGYWVYGNKVAFLSSLKECFGFTIESAELVQTQTAQFEALWQLSTPLQGKNAATAHYLKNTLT